MTLELYRSSTLDRAKRWSDLNPKERRCWAVGRFVNYSGEQAVNLLRMTGEDGVRFVRTVESAGLSPASTRGQLAGVRL